MPHIQVKKAPCPSQLAKTRQPVNANAQWSNYYKGTTTIEFGTCRVKSLVGNNIHNFISRLRINLCPGIHKRQERYKKLQKSFQGFRRNWISKSFCGIFDERSESKMEQIDVKFRIMFCCTSVKCRGRLRRFLREFNDRYLLDNREHQKTKFSVANRSQHPCFIG